MEATITMDVYLPKYGANAKLEISIDRTLDTVSVVLIHPGTDRTIDMRFEKEELIKLLDFLKWLSD